MLVSQFGLQPTHSSMCEKKVSLSDISDAYQRYILEPRAFFKII